VVVEAPASAVSEAPTAVLVAAVGLDGRLGLLVFEVVVEALEVSLDHLALSIVLGLKP
jgi:hypothetical protein